MKRYLRYFMVFMAVFLLVGCGAPQQERENAGRDTVGNTVEMSASGSLSPGNERAPDLPSGNNGEETASLRLDEDGIYSSRDDVALYIHTYGHLPSNYITKKEAEKLGWKGGSLEDYAPGKCIGGSRFGNYEGLLPEKEGRVYTECDIDTLGEEKRGAKRIVFSDDGLIYYTEDHYESFELLYGEE